MTHPDEELDALQELLRNRPIPSISRTKTVRNLVPWRLLLRHRETGFEHDGFDKHHVETLGWRREEVSMPSTEPPGRVNTAI